MGRTRLSLCMIVKNEEDCIARCLESVEGVVDEIVIIDTGSTDRTIEICQSFEAVIEKYDWSGSFADARNYGIKKATGDWILWLDADEEVDAADKFKLNEGTHFNNYDAINVHLINYYGEKIDENRSTDIAHTRLFRNNGIRFINKMHECLDLGHLSRERIGYLNVKVHHYGYLDSIMEKKKKSERNLKMLKQQIKEGENVYWAHYYIALEHYHRKEYPKALEHVNLSILAFLQNKALPSSMVYKLKYSILIAMGSFKEALAGIEKAMMLYPDYVDLRFFKGMILYQLEHYEHAIIVFNECINLGEDNKDYLILKGVGSFQAWYYISLCQQKLNQKEEAVVSILDALFIAPQYMDALNELSQFINKEEQSVFEILKKHFKGDKFHALKKIVQNFKN